jgi:hypothetical protein
MRGVLVLVLIGAAVLAWQAPRRAAADAVEEAAAAVSRGFDGFDPALRAALAPTLAAWIEAERDAAVASGVEPVPQAVRDALAGFVAAEVLERARWRVDDSTVSLERALFRMGYTPAITLDDVVIFRHADDAADPKLWAHEIVHVAQYRDWGIAEFARRYLADYEAVEREAAEFRWSWMRATDRVPDPGGALD